MTIPTAPSARALAFLGASLLIGVSAAMNAVYGWETGAARSVAHAAIYAAGSFGGDLLKPFCLLVALTALRSREWVKALAGLALGCACITYAGVAAVGFTATTRGDAKAERTALLETHRRAKAHYDQAALDLAGVLPARPALELQPLIEKITMTAGANSCIRVDGPVSRRVCSEAAELKAELGRAERRAELKRTIREASAALAELPFIAEPDPQAASIAAYLSTLGFKTRADQVSPWLAIIVAAFFEVGSALSLVVASSVGQASPTATSRLPADGAPTNSVPKFRPIGLVGLSKAITGSRRRALADSEALRRLRAAASAGGRLETTQDAIGRLLGLTKITAHRQLHRLKEEGKISLTASRRGTRVHVL